MSAYFVHCYLSLPLLFQSSDQSLRYCSLDCSRLSPGFWRAHKDALYCSMLRTLSRVRADGCGMLGPLDFLSLTFDGDCLQPRSMIGAPIGKGRWDNTHDIVGPAGVVCWLCYAAGNNLNSVAAWRKRGVELVLTVGKIYERAFIFIRPFARDGRPPFDPGHNRHLVTFHTYTLHSNTTSWILLHYRDT